MTEKKNNFKRYSLFPKTLSQCIEPVTRPAFKGQGLAGTKIISEWQKIVGDKLADRSIPQKLSFPTGKKEGGTLSIAVENGFAPEIQHLQPLILEKLAIYFGYKAVTKIVISHNYSPKQAQPPAKSKTTQKPLPASCIELTAEIEDEQLRAALKNIAKILSGS